MQLPEEILQALIDQSYRVAVEVHWNDVPEWDIEMPLFQVLRRIKEDFELEPTNYGLLGEPQLLLGE